MYFFAAAAAVAALIALRGSGLFSNALTSLPSRARPSGGSLATSRIRSVSNATARLPCVNLSVTLLKDWARLVRSVLVPRALRSDLVSAPLRDGCQLQLRARAALERGAPAASHPEQHRNDNQPHSPASCAMFRSNWPTSSGHTVATVATRAVTSVTTILVRVDMLEL